MSLPAPADTSCGPATSDGPRSVGDPGELDCAAPGRASRCVGPPVGGVIDGDLVGSAVRPEEGDTGVGAGGGVAVDWVERVVSGWALPEVDRAAGSEARSGFLLRCVPAPLAGSAAR